MKTKVIPVGKRVLVKKKDADGNIILNNDVPIHTIITGHACSAASILSIIGAKRYIAPNSYMLIHNISSGFWGKMHEMEDEMKNLENIIKLYSKIKGKDKCYKNLDRIFKLFNNSDDETCDENIQLIGDIVELIKKGSDPNISL